MVLWGGLRPIVSQAVVDAVTLTVFGATAVAKPSTTSWGLMGAAAGLAVAVSGNLTNRWTVIFPMIPFICLQTLRLVFKKSKWISRLLLGLSLLLVFSSAALSVLFPAVELAPLAPSGDFNVGVVDVYLPINLQFTSPFPETQHVVPSEQDHATIRILYPTLEEAVPIPYLRPHTSEVYCEENMKHSAPPPLRAYPWIIHNWRLIEIPGKHHAQPTVAHTRNGRLPVVFFSHGLGGDAQMYAYQTHSLAAHGYLVVVLDHTDGSAPVVARKDGELLRRNETILQQWLDGEKDLYKQSRQTMTAYRAQELLAVVESFLHLNKYNLPELHGVGLDFRNKLDTSDIHYMGHSFGAASALHAAGHRPPKSVLAHDPATDWMPKESRLSLFDIERLKDSKTNHSYWTAGSEAINDGNGNEAGVEKKSQSTLHDTTELMILFSDEWYSKKWSGSDVLKDMHERDVFGRKGGASRFGVIDGAYHNEFSDVCMITPLWIARDVGLTGPRNPHDTAREIHEETVAFLKDMGQQS